MNNPDIAVSIIIAAYNASGHIERALDSCLGQTFQNFEVIIINDGSTDDTLQIVGKYTERDSRFSVYSQPNAGQGVARNRAIERAVGEFVTILDADDELLENFLQKLINVARRENSDIAMAEYLTVNNESGKRYYIPVMPSYTIGNISWAQRRAVLNRAHYTVAKLYKRSLLEKNGIRYGEGYIYEDSEFVVGAMVFAERISSIPDPLYRVHVEPSSTTRSDTSSDRHSHGLVSAFQGILSRYPASRLYDFRDVISRWMLRRVVLYSIKQRRVPIRYWLSFTKEIMSTVKFISDGERFYQSLSPIQRVSMRTFERSRHVGAAVFLALSLLHRFAPFRKALKRYWGVARKLKSKIHTAIQRRAKARSIKSALKAPLDFNIVLLHGFGNNIRGNTKYVLEALVSAGFNVHLVTREKEAPDGVTVIHPWSVQHHQALTVAGIHILESWVPLAIGKRDGAVWVQLWHGTPFKRLLFDSQERDLTLRNPKNKLQKMKDIARWDFVIAQNAFCKAKLSSSFAFPSTRIETTGYPRTDWTSIDLNLVRHLIREKYGVDPEKKILLYAPTWRDYNQFSPITDMSYLLDWARLKKEMPDYVLLYTGHPFGKEVVLSDQSLICANNDDFQHLLVSADALVTDYSSAVFDYLSFDRPFCLLAKDLDEYERSRGVYGEILVDFAQFVAQDEKEAAEILLNPPGLKALQNLDRYLEPEESSATRLVELLKEIGNGANSS